MLDFCQDLIPQSAEMTEIGRTFLSPYQLICMDSKHQLAFVTVFIGRRGNFFLGHSIFTPFDFAEFSKLNFTASMCPTTRLKTSFKS